MENYDDSSSDSSIDNYFKSSDKINFNSPFFNTNNSNQSNVTNVHEEELNSNISDDSEKDDDDDFIADDNNHKSSTALLAEVMKNLERINENEDATAKNSSNLSTPLPSTSQQLSPSKNDILSREINELLMQGESDLGSSKFQLSSDNNETNQDTTDYSIPKNGIAITLPGTGLMFNHRKKHCGVDLIDELRKKINRRLRSNQLFVHKVGLLCWLAHGFHLNKLSNDAEIMSIVLSLTPQKIYPKNRVDLKYLEQFTKWFKSLFKIKLNKDSRNNKKNDDYLTDVLTKDTLINALTNKQIDNNRTLVLLYISTLRAIGINCRLIVSLYPPDLKPKHNELFQPQNTTKYEEKNMEKEVNKRKESNKQKNMKLSVKVERKSKNKSILTDNIDDDDDDDDDDSDFESKQKKIIPKNSKQAARVASEEAKKRAAELIRLKYMKKSDKKKQFQHNVEKKLLNDNEEKVESPHQARQLRSRTIASNNSKRISEKNTGARSCSILKQNIENSSDDDNEDEDEKKKQKGRIKRNNIKTKSVKKSSTADSKKSIDRRVLSSDENSENDIKKNIKFININYLWVEVYVESEENWICVSVPDDKIHCVTDIYKKLPTPVLYIIGYNSAGKIKDVTRRYCSSWLTVTRKQRIDDKWWNETLSPWTEENTARSKAEDESLAQSEMEQPLPKSISECKGHPLYALARHLLKFEALYPPDCLPLGHLKNGEAIYSRYCVHTLRSRETWLKQARVVKPAQEPYKIVKAMPKYDKLTGQMIKDQPLELFGHWQTMSYIPPEAKNGKVPRNEYGNVDLFQKCMLPKGTVHIDLPGLFRVAKKLNIDCVAAVVGFNFGGRGAMPMTQGYVVCEEYEDTLREAWEEEQIKADARAKDKRDKRIWGNWRKLIRGLLIREKITAKYGLKQNNEDDNNDNDDNDDDDNDDEKKLPKRTKISNRKMKKKKIE